MKIKTFILTFLLMMMSSPIIFGQEQTRVRNFGELRDAINRGDSKIELSNEINVSEGLIVQSGSTITLDLNGWGLEADQGTYVITNLGTLTIEDGFNGQGSITGRGILNGNSTAPEASLTINSGIYRGIANAGAAVYNNYGTVKINGGEFYGKQAAIVNKGTMNIECDPLNEEVLIDGEGVNNLAIINIGTLDIKGAAVIIGKEEISVDAREEGYFTYDEDVIFAEAKIQKGDNITYYESLADAFNAAQNNDNVEIFCAGVYALSTSGKNITITGLSDGIVFDNIGGKNMNGANVTFTNVTFDYYPNVNYTGLQHSGDLVYNNCTFDGQPFLYGTSETFNNCTFNQNSSDAYNVWTYGAKEVVFNECTFNSAGKSVLIYSEEATLVNDVNVTKCTFKASTPVEGKAAIEMDSSRTAGIKLTIDGETTAQGFAPGSVSESSLWNNKMGNQGANNDITVIVDDEIVLEPHYSVELNGTTKYETLKEAVKACVEGDNVITLLEDNTEAFVVIDQVEGKNIVIDGGNESRYDFVGTIYIHGNARFTEAEKLTIKNIDFNNKNLKAAHDYISSDSTDSHKRYAHNVTIENCNFTAPAGTEYDVVAMRFRQSYNIDVIDCDFTNLHSVMWTTGTSGVEFDKITATACKNGMHIGGGSNGVVVKNSSLGVENYGIRAEGSGKDFTIENSTIDANIPVVVRKVTAGTTTNFTFKGVENTMTQNNPHNYWFVAGTGDNEYEGGEDLPTTAGQVIVNLSGSNLNYDGVYGNYYVAEIDGVKYTTIVEALNAVKKDQIIKIVDNAKGDESTEIVTVEVIEETDGRFKMDGNAPEYKFPKIILKNDMDIVSINTNEHKTNLNNLNIDVQAGHLRINNSNVDGIFTVATNMSLANSYLNGTITNNGRINVSGTSNINSAERIAGSGKFYMNAVEMDDRTNMKFANVVFEGSTAERVNNLKGSNIQNSIFTVQNNTIVNVTDNAYIAGPINQADGAHNHHVVEGKLNIVNSAAKFNLLDVATAGYLRVEGSHTHEDYYLYGNTMYVNHDIVNEGTIEFVKTNVSTNNLILSSGITVDDESVLKVRNNMNINGAELTINGNVTAANTEVEGDVVINMNKKGAKFATPNEIEGIVLNCGAEDCKIVYYEDAYQVVDKNFANLDVVMIVETGVGYPTFEEALANVETGQTIQLLRNPDGDDEKETVISYDGNEPGKAKSFYVTGEAQGYIMPLVTFKNVTVNIKGAKFSSRDIDARDNAIINITDGSVIYNEIYVKNPTVKAASNGVINIENSTVYTKNVLVLGKINITGNSIVNASMATSVFETGRLNIGANVQFNTATLDFTGEEYSTASWAEPADNSYTGPAMVTVNGATFVAGQAYRSDGTREYDDVVRKYGICIGTEEPNYVSKKVKFDVANSTVQFYMPKNANPTGTYPCTNPIIGEYAEVNINASSFEVLSNTENHTVVLQNNGTVYVTGESNINASVEGDGWFYMNGVTMSDKTQLLGAKVGFINGENTITGSTIKDGWFNVGIGKYAEAERAQTFATANDITLGNVTVNVSGDANIDGNGDTYSGWVGSAYGADKTQHTYTLNVVKSLAAFGYMHVSKDGIMNIDGRSADDNRYTYDNANVNFYAGDLIVNGNVKINDADAWVKYTYMSPDHVGGVLDITGTTNYESSIHNGAATGTSLKFYQAGEVNIGKDSKVEIDNKTILVEGSVFNTSGIVTAEGVITNAGEINVLDGTMTAKGNIDNNGTLTVDGDGTLVADAQLKTTHEVTVAGTLKHSDIDVENTITVESGTMAISGTMDVYNVVNKVNADNFQVTENGKLDVVNFTNNGIVNVTKPEYIFVASAVTGEDIDCYFNMTNVDLIGNSKLKGANIKFNDINTLYEANLEDSKVTVNTNATLTVSEGSDDNINTINVASLANSGKIELETYSTLNVSENVTNFNTGVVNLAESSILDVENKLTNWKELTIGQNAEVSANYVVNEVGSTTTVNGTLTATTSLSNAVNATIKGSGNIGVDASNVTVLTNEGKIIDDLTISVYTINNYNEIEVDKIVSTNFENYSGWVTVDNADLYSNYFRNAATVNVLGEGSSVIIDNIDNTAIGKFNMTNVNLTKPVEVGGSYESGYKLNGANIELLGENTADGIEFSNSTDVNVIGKLTISNAVAVDGVVETTGEIILNEGATFKTTNNSLNVTTEVEGQHPMYDSEEGWYELHSNDDYVANIKDTENYYETLQSAVDAAEDGQTVVIMKDVTEDVTVANSINFETVTIDEQIVAVTVAGTLTVEAENEVSFNYANVTFNSTRVGANVVLNINNSIYNVTTLFTDGTYAEVNVGAGSKLNASEKIQFGYSYCTLNIGGTVVTNKFNVPEKHTIVLNQLSATLTTTNNALTVSLPAEDQFADYKVAYVDGVYKVVDKEYIAQVGESRFETIAEAVQAAQVNGEEVVLTANAINETVTINDPVTITTTLDSQIVVNGNLTVNANVTFENVNIKFNSTNVVATLNILGSTYFANTFATGASKAIVNVGEESVLEAVQKLQLAYSNSTMNIAGSVVAHSQFNVASAYTIVLDHHDATLTTTNSALKVSTSLTDDHKVSYKNGMYQLVGKFVAQIVDVKYETLADALEAVPSNGEIKLLWEEGNDPIVMAGVLTGKNATITQAVATDSIYVDWSKGWLFIARGAEFDNGPSTLTFQGVDLRSVNDGVGTDDNRYGINVSAKRKNTENYNGTLVIKDSNVELSYLYNAYEATFDNSTVTLVNANGMNVGGLLAAYTTTGEPGTATLNIKNGTTFNVTNITIGYDGIGIMNVDATSVVNNKESQYGLNVIEDGILNTSGNFDGYSQFNVVEGEHGGIVNVSSGIYSFDVNAYCVEGVAAFELPNGYWEVRETKGTQTRELALAGWYWFSSYISDLEGTAGLQLLQSELDPYGKQIKGQFGFSNYFGTKWSTAGLQSVTTAQMYMLNTTAPVTLEFEGEFVDYSNTPIVLNPGWNWIGYPVRYAQTAEVALANLQPKDGDIIKGKEGSSTYYVTDEFEGWFPELILEPGHGHMYFSNSDEQVTFVFNSNGQPAESKRATAAMYWNVNETAYPSNMTMIATTDIEGGDYEVAAFVNGEVRGSARPIYVEAMDAYVLVLTIQGNDVEEMTFRYYDNTTGEVMSFSNRINYTNDAIIGSMAEPYKLTRGTTGIGEVALSDVNIYPNPTTTGVQVNLDATCEKVEIFNALGVKVAEYQNVDSIDAFETAGIYVIRLTNGGEIKHTRLVVR